MGKGTIRVQPLLNMVFHANPLLIYAIVALVLFLESTGIPITNNTLLLFTGALAALGHLNIWILTISAIIGSIAGAWSAYTLGKWKGHRVLQRIAALFHVNTKKMSMAENWFQKSGAWMIFFSRMTPYIRPFACFPAGISRMPFQRFFLAALVGSIIWCFTLVRIGAALGPHWRLALTLIQTYTIPTCATLIMLIVLYFSGRYAITRYLRSRRHEDGNDGETEEKACDHNLLEV
ncbi:MAG TPA: DedA family protein [Ktedonobacteraceae bacterium]|nr:DedA family protein [Ktedonobacteraceae bacterium]